MRAFEHHFNMHEIIAEFKKQDQKHERFILNIEGDIYDFFADHNIKESTIAVLSQHLRPFVLALINNSYSVLEKDSHYPDYRMKIELENHKFLIKHAPTPAIDKVLYTSFSSLIKQHIVQAFPAVYHLSANGFRLLEQSMNYHINIFANNFDKE